MARPSPSCRGPPRFVTYAKVGPARVATKAETRVAPGVGHLDLRRVRAHLACLEHPFSQVIAPDARSRAPSTTTWAYSGTLRKNSATSAKRVSRKLRTGSPTPRASIARAMLRVHASRKAPSMGTW
jgi:hypothetical protein